MTSAHVYMKKQARNIIDGKTVHTIHNVTLSCAKSVHAMRILKVLIQFTTRCEHVSTTGCKV